VSIVGVAVIVAVIVIGRVIVAALVSGNDAVDLIDAVNEDATGGWERQSVPQNVAADCGRATHADKGEYYASARASAMESASHLEVTRVDDAGVHPDGTT
jgi:hypothetical protein